MSVQLIQMFDPDLNPYVTKLEEHRDIIMTGSVEENQDLVDFVKSPQPLVADLGCGAGNFLRDYALKAPEKRFVGFELRFKRLVKGAVKFKKHNVSNVRLIQAKAEEIDLWIPESSLSEVYVNFPDPWPKKRHKKHRLMTKHFLDKMQKLLTYNGILSFKTDHKTYFDSVTELLDQISSFRLVEYSEDLHNSEFDDSNIRTEFESLFKGKGYPVYYLKLEACQTHD